MLAYAILFLREFGRIVLVGKGWADGTVKIVVASLLVIAAIGAFTLGHEWRIAIMRDGTTMATLLFWPVLYGVIVFVIVVAAAVLTWHSVPRMRFISEGMRLGEQIGHPSPAPHWSVVVENTSLIRSIRKPVVRWVWSNPKVPNMPIALHQKGDGWDKEAKRPDIEPSNTATFDLLIQKGEQWQIPTEHLNEPIFITPGEYEIFLQASARDTPPTKVHRVFVSVTFTPKGDRVPVTFGRPVPVKRLEKKG